QGEFIDTQVAAEDWMTSRQFFTQASLCLRGQTASFYRTAADLRLLQRLLFALLILRRRSGPERHNDLLMQSIVQATIRVRSAQGPYVPVSYSPLPRQGPLLALQSTAQ